MNLKNRKFISNKKIFFSLVCIGLVVLGLFFSKMNSQSPIEIGLASEHIDSLPRSPVSQNFAIETKNPYPKSPVDTVSNLSQFDSPEGIEYLKKQILEIGSYISLKKSLQEFQASDLDSPVNAERAKEILLSSYPDEIEEEFVIRRVVAAYFLKYSKHLKAEDCPIFIDTLLKQYEAIDLEGHRRAIQFDVGSVAYMCTRVGGENFEKKIAGITIPALKGQSLNAMAVYHEHSQRGDGNPELRKLNSSD